MPARRADQLAQVVVQPRIIRPVKAHTYTNSYTMFKQNGNFSGIGTCSATSFGDFSQRSMLSSEVEARSIRNRPDINAHLSKLRKEDVITEWAEQDRREFARVYVPNELNQVEGDYRRYARGKILSSIFV